MPSHPPVLPPHSSPHYHCRMWCAHGLGSRGSCARGEPSAPPKHCAHRGGVVSPSQPIIEAREVFKVFTAQGNRHDRRAFLALHDVNLAAEAGKYIAMVGLGGFEHHFPHELSGGMRKRAALIRTLIYEPDVVLMDEPFGPLDAQTRVILQDELLKLWEGSGKSILF